MGGHNEIIKGLSTEPTLSEQEFFAILHKLQHLKNPYTTVLEEQTAGISDKIGRELELTEEDLSLLELAALFSDIGMIGVDNNSIYRPDSLTEKENESIYLHPIVGAEILGTNKNTALSKIVRDTHDNWNGIGSPNEGRKWGIQPLSRIIRVAADYVSLTSISYLDLVPRTRYTADEAIEQIKQESGTKYDPAVVSALEAVVLKEKVE